MADSSDIDNAIVAKLLGDATLMALTPDGIFFDEGAPGLRRFVVISLVDEHDEPMFGGRAFEDGLYQVEARMLSTSGGNVKAAAARIDTLLDGGTLTASGYSLMTMRRVERVRVTEVDDADKSIRWQRRGGRYQIMVTA
jgi:hypothetical protein